MSEYFLLPLEPEGAFCRFDELVASLLPEYRTPAEAFRHSLASTHSTVALPVSLAIASVEHRHFTRLHIVERLRALRDSDPGEGLDKEKEGRALQVAAERMNEFTTSGEGKDAINQDICDFLFSAFTNRGLEPATRELIQQGIILLWSAFEVLFRDVFELHLNLNPSLAVDLAQDPSTRKRFQVERVLLDALVEYEFDLANRLGSVLMNQQDLGDLPTIRRVYSVVFPGSGDLAERLNDADLWLLYQRRHLLVHRRGIVDKAYVENTSDAAPMNETLALKPDDLETHFKVVLLVGEALLSSLPMTEESPG